MATISDVPADPTPTLCTTEVLLIVLFLCGLFMHFLVNRFSTFAVLRTADKHRSRTLVILRQSLDHIALEEYTALFDRYTMLSDMRADWKSTKNYFAVFPAGPRMQRWLVATKALRDDVEVAFERSTRDFVGTMLAERRKTGLGAQQQV